MAVLTPSRSARLAHPGEHLVPTDERPVYRSDVDATLPYLLGEHAEAAPVEKDDLRTRETRWVCEWWPPS